ncbi:Tetratricopeptide repeat-containing protein [Devosia lucknowensis]|uniref:Tetratricopeptide repeat-containing protein n=1 Tax=Devosia lucknowensis TaxID=1096929 RepID=A0A1Y6EC94_9HYPH|nr:tetratricopeptide repeat protein [Devosia lucknowensis]SMQ60155.1 Tetratricopeptide repeat-containing protein [Devosia lucknowensis]
MTIHARCIIVGLFAGLSMTAAPLAQQATPTPELSQAAPPAASPVVDESALRYFARQGDERRLQAEIARLSAIYPGWVPPADPLNGDTGVDENLQHMWDLYGQGDLAGVQAEIDARMAATPDWRPPQDLLDALSTGSAAAEIRAAATVQDYDTVIRVAANHPDILVCTNVDLLWSLAEAFVDTGSEPRAVDAYSFVLQNCPTAPERLATMQKARTLLSPADMDTLFSFERDDEFAPIRVDQARQSVADYLNGVSRQVDPDAVTLIESAIAAAPTTDDLRLLGYYELQANRARQARDLFQKAVDIDPTPDSLGALARAMVQLRQLTEAEELLAEHRFESDELQAQYLALANSLLAGNPPRRLTPEVLDRIIEAINDSQDADAAQALGWYAFNFGQTQTAARWFLKALEFNPNFEPAAYGLLVSSQKLQDRARVREIIRQWGSLSPRIEQFGKPGAPTDAPVITTIPEPQLVPMRYRFDQGPRLMLVASQTPDQLRAYEQCGQYIPAENFSGAQALGRAWCLMDLDRATEAEQLFQRAILAPSEATRTEAYYGLTLALLRLGLIEEAAVAASAMPQTPERVHEMQIAILADTAVTYYQIGRYDEVLQLLDQRATLAPEQNDLLTIRAWSYYHLGRLREARQIFAAVAATGYSEAQRGLDALQARGFQ